MSDPSEDTARPTKRARLDDDTAPTLSAEASAPAPQSATIAPKATSTAAIDEDLEREVRAGITEYVCPDNLGFTGVLKQRYTDFLVNEIGLDGQVLHLKSTDVPSKKKGEKQTNGRNPEKEAAEAQMVESKEETGDSEMVDAQKGGSEEQRETAKSEDTPAPKSIKIIMEDEQNPEVKQEEPKEEPEEEVCFSR